MGLSLERLRLVIHFDDNGRAFYPLELGAYSIGSNEFCTIRLQNPEVRDLHAILSIDHDGVSLEDRTTLPSESGNLAYPTSRLEIGDIVGIGPYQLGLIELEPSRKESTRGLSHKTHHQVQELWRQVRRGLPGFNDILASLAPVISPEEAQAAKTATRASLNAFVFTIAALTILVTGSALLPNWPKVAAITYDLANAGFLVGSLGLISLYQINFAGRLMVPLLWVLNFLEPPRSDWYELPQLPFVLSNLALAFVLGALLDFGASAEPGRGYRNLRKFTLLAVGGIAISHAIDKSNDFLGWNLLFSVGAGIFCMLWSWWPGPRIEHQLLLGNSDVRFLQRIGLRRWCRCAVGRLLALCFGLLPALLFLHSFQISERLKWPTAGSPDEALRSTAPEPRVFFWEQTAHLLQPVDLWTHDFYGFFNQTIPADRFREIRLYATALDDDPADRFSFNKLKDLLLPYKLTSPPALLSLLSKTKADRGQQSLYYLEENRLTSRGPFRVPRVIFSARDQLSIGYNQFIGYTQEDIETRETNSRWRRFALVICGFLGVFTLWKRGGDWGFALWLGLWFMGVGTIGTYRYSSFFSSKIGYDIWHRALASSHAYLLLGIFRVMDSLVLVEIIAFAAFISCAAVWTWACWPTDSSSSLRLRKIAVPEAIVLTGRIIVVAASMNILFWGAWYMFSYSLPRSAWKGDLAPILAGVIFVIVTLAASARVRKISNKCLKPLDWWSGLLFLSTQALVLLSTPEVPRLAARSTTLTMLGYALISALVLLFLLRVARRNFLRLFTIRDASLALTAVAVLTVLRMTESFMDKAVDLFANTIGVPEYGAKALGLSTFVLLIPPIHRLIERFMLFLSMTKMSLKRPYVSLRRLAKIEKKIQGALDLLLNLRDPRNIGQIQQALLTCGITEYAFFSRKDKSTFAGSVTCGNLGVSGEIELSPLLLGFLAKQKKAIDLKQLAYRWDLFFFQFELERLRQELAAKYLIPINLGESLRGLLIISNDADQRALAGEGVTESITDIALVTTQLRYQHSISSTTL